MTPINYIKTKLGPEDHQKVIDKLNNNDPFMQQLLKTLARNLATGQADRVDWNYIKTNLQ
jgi:hypothetical protein